METNGLNGEEMRTEEGTEKKYKCLTSGNASIDSEGESAKQMAKKKLEEELKAAKDKTFAEPVIGYLLKRCGEDEGLAEDVAQGHKTWEKCLDYIYGKARKQAVGNRAAVRDDVVFEWAEDYYHKDDKAEEGKKAKEPVGRKAEQEREAESKPIKIASDSGKKEEKQMEQPNAKKNSKNMDGQIDMFSMMEM